MTERVLVTGGAGFIGSHLVDALIERGHDVVVLDSLVAQVHGSDAARPDHLHPAAELVQADVRDRDALSAQLARCSVVFHEAASVGVGQSMYDVVDYVTVNVVGTATLCELLARGEHAVRKVLVASSMSNYGEGAYDCEVDGRRNLRPRPLAQLQAKDWELRCDLCGRSVEPAPTDEEKPMRPTSVYATTKRDQEELVLNVCGAYDIPAVALRYFNIYGTRQSLSNPYTGVAAIFSSRMLNGEAPLVFEDGLQSRDFTHVSDVVQANLLAMERPDADGQVLNVGTGVQTTMLDLIRLLGEGLGVDTLKPEILGRFREGDIRHCYSDITRISSLLGFRPSVKLESGVGELAAWAREQRAVDRAETAMSELEARGLVR